MRTHENRSRPAHGTWVGVALKLQGGSKRRSMRKMVGEGEWRRAVVVSWLDNGLATIFWSNLTFPEPASC